MCAATASTTNLQETTKKIKIKINNKLIKLKIKRIVKLHLKKIHMVHIIIWWRCKIFLMIKMINNKNIYEYKNININK